MLLTHALYSQCVINVKGVPCVGNPMEFEAQAPGSTNHSWNFNNEGFNNTTAIPKFTFGTVGQKTISMTCKLSNGQTCNTTINITIKDTPKVQMRLLGNGVQCFENNQFCIRDSSLSGDNNSCIKSIKYLFSDGELITKYGSKNNPVALPATICKSFIDPQGGNYTLTVEIEDCNGCIVKRQLPFTMKVQLLPSIFASSTFISDRCKGTANVNFYNQSQIKRSDVARFLWDFGDGTIDSTSWDSVTHFYSAGTKMNAGFSPKLIIYTGIGCRREFILSDVIIYNFKPTMTMSRDSICVNESIDFEVFPKELKEFIVDEKVRWSFDPGLSYGYKTFNTFSNLGGHIVSVSLAHVCGPYNLSDTVVVIGPNAIIEPDYIRPEERYQCAARDSVHVTDHSKYYHNDRDMLDDDSLYSEKAGNLKYVFHVDPQSGRIEPFKPYDYDRDKDNVLRMWDFDDPYCLPCTTDRTANENVGMNCRFSKDTSDVHAYTDWDSVYNYLYKKKPQSLAYFDRANQTCGSKNIWFGDSMYAVIDSVIYYGNNNLGISARDSVAFKHIKHRIALPKDLSGKGAYDFPYDVRIYIPAGSSVNLISRNGGSNLFVNGPQYYNVSSNYRISTNAGNACYLIYAIKVYKDTLHKADIRLYHKIISQIKTPGYTAGDSVNPVLHRKLFYHTIPRCFKITLALRDTVHPFKCESVASSAVALLPPSAKRLAINDHFCYGYDYKVVEFDLSETKPGCLTSTVWFNPDYVNKPNNWLLLNDLYGGEMMRQTFLNGKSPYVGYVAEGPNIGQFYWVYNDTALPKKNVQDINVGLIIGNGVDPTVCSDTIYYKNFASFPRLSSDLVFADNRLKKNGICAGETAYVTIPRKTPDANALASNSYWYIIDNLSSDTLERIDERYYKVQDHPKYPGKKVNYTVIVRSKINNTGILAPYQTDTIVTGIVNAYKAVALPGAGYNTLRARIANMGLDIQDFPDSVVLELIWNGVGTIGMPSTGSKGCVDTAGFGHQLDWYYRMTSVNILHYKDTSLLPADSVMIGNQYVKAYGFHPKRNGSYTIYRDVESYFPSWCPLSDAVALAVGFDAQLELSDSIICRGRLIELVPKFRYYNISQPLLFALDTLDYWFNRQNQAGANNREGLTIWDLSKEDDNNANPATIFGAFPYVKKGYGQPGFLVGNEPGAIYYKTPGIYTLRVSSTDSNYCPDTISQRIYVTGPKAAFYTDVTTPNCKTILEFFDTSYVVDPCVLAGKSPCDNIIKWEIDWGDGSAPLLYTKELPKQIGHDYTKNGYYKITLVVESVLGCRDSISKLVYIPGPSPIFTPVSSVFICVNDSVTFNNLTPYSTGSSQWLWNFGDGFYSPQYDTGLITHQYTRTGTFDVFLNQYDSIANSGKFCPAIYPDLKMGQQKITVTVLPYDTVKLFANPIIVCIGDTIGIRADLKTASNYKKYNWTFGKDNISTTDLTLKAVPKRKGRFLVTWAADTIGVNTGVCPDFDSIVVYADSVMADFIISKKDAPEFCFTNRSKWAVSYRWGFFHDTDITVRKLQFKQDATQGLNDSVICRNFIDHVGVNWICLEATNALGCMDTVCKKIVNDYEMAIQPPNVFTPNADAFTGTDRDGLPGNEVFNIYCKNVVYYHLVIYDRWGVKVFESDNDQYDWNGRVMNTGYMCPDGTYYYILDYRYKGRDKNEPLINGVVRIIR